MQDWVVNVLEPLGLPSVAAEVLASTAVLVGVVLLCGLAYWLSQAVLVRLVAGLAARTRTNWDDLLVENKVFSRLAHFAPALVVYSFAETLGAQEWIERIAVVWLIVVATALMNALLDAGTQIYETYPVSRERPIRSYAQGAQIVLYLIAGILIVSTLLDRSPWGLLAGLGAVSAVIMLVFRDSILGFAASLQLAANDMVRPDDWIEMPDFGADGDVIEVGLHSVKVRNWDKTVSTIPTYALMTHSFKNWRGMSESGGRRIKRAIHLDVSSIKFCDAELIARLEQMSLLREYLQQKRDEITAFNAEHGADGTTFANGRHLTNLGTFRAYIVAYLRAHPKIHADMTFLVRQLAPTETGVPIEIYVFSNDQDWIAYEGIQSDIFDHLLAITQHFDLRVYQNPSASDLLEAARLIAPSLSATR